MRHVVRVRRLCAAVFGVAVLALMSGNSRAESITAKFLDTNIDEIVGIKLGSAPAELVYAGKYHWQRTDGGVATPPADFFTFCIEITQDIVPGGVYTYT